MKFVGGAGQEFNMLFGRIISKREKYRKWLETLTKITMKVINEKFQLRSKRVDKIFQKLYFKRIDINQHRIYEYFEQPQTESMKYPTKTTNLFICLFPIYTAVRSQVVYNHTTSLDFARQI